MIDDGVVQVSCIEMGEYTLSDNEYSSADFIPVQ